MAARRIADRQALRRSLPEGSDACRAGCQPGPRLCGRATCASLRIAGRRETSKRPTARSRHFTARLPAPAPHRPPLTMGRSCLAAPSVHRHSLGLYVSRLPCTAPPGLLARARPRHREVRVARFARLRSVLASPHLARSDRQRQRPLGGRMEPTRKEASDMGSAIGKRRAPARLHQAGRRLANRRHAARTAVAKPGAQETEVLRHGRCPPYSRKLPICRPRSSASCESA